MKAMWFRNNTSVLPSIDFFDDHWFKYLHNFVRTLRLTHYKNLIECLFKLFK